MPKTITGKPELAFASRVKRLSAMLTLAGSVAIMSTAVAQGHSLLVTGVSQNSSSLAAQVEHLNILRERVEALQDQHGQYNPDILHAMNGLGEALIAAGELREANDVLEQQIQILRVNDGLYTDGQIALVHRQLAVMAAQRNWLGMQDRLSYLSWLLERSETLSDSEKLNNMKVMRDWTRLLLSRGPRQHEAAYLLQLRDIEESSLALARATISDTSVVQHMIYDQAIAELYLALGIVGGSDTSWKLIEKAQGLQSSAIRPSRQLGNAQDLEAIYGARTSTAIERSHRAAMMRHYLLIKELEALIAGPADGLGISDPAAEAMVQLYLGDSVLLRQQYELNPGTLARIDRGSSITGSAARYYQRAWDLLLQAEYSAEQLNHYFSCPAPLPRPRFERVLELDDRECSLTDQGALQLPATAVVNHGIPGLRFHAMPQNSLMSDVEGVSTTLTFIVGVNGQASRIQVLAAEPDKTFSRIRGRDALQDMQFRPALKDGKAVPANEVHLTIYSLEPG